MHQSIDPTKGGNVARQVKKSHPITRRFQDIENHQRDLVSVQLANEANVRRAKSL